MTIELVTRISLDFLRFDNRILFTSSHKLALNYMAAEITNKFSVLK
jgi:hypothetical protein